MIVDAAGPDRAAFARPFDLCVIGAGPAGITLARRAAAQGLEVALLEAGGREITEESQAVYEGEVVGRDYWPLEVSRLRYLGGSSGHWGGWCRPLDAVDFQPKAWNPWSGWPIGPEDLAPYAAETDAIIGLPPFEPDAPPVDGFREVFFRYSDPPTQFGEKFAPELEASPRIRVGLNANLVDLRLAPDGRRVTGAAFRALTPGAPEFVVAARAYALCCGGIENPRLLLNFDSQAAGGIGNGHDLVGRYFAEHPHYSLAEALFREAAPEKQELRFFAPTREFIDREEVLNFGLRQERMPAPFVLRPGTVAGDPSCDDPFILRLAEKVAQATPACGPGGTGEIAFDGRLRIAHEQALNPDSRVRLAEARDALGLRRAALDWRLSELDARTVRAAVLGYARRMAERDTGRARLHDWVLPDPIAWPDTTQDEVAGKHHMGATRMAADPARGVVDADCRVHGIGNLYIGGSSVFATSGHANPTYTIIQLSLRLGDHLGRTLKG